MNTGKPTTMRTAKRETPKEAEAKREGFENRYILPKISTNN